MDSTDTETNQSMKYFPHEFPTLKCKAVTLRMHSINDTPQAYSILNDIEVIKNLKITPYPYSTTDYSEFLQTVTQGFANKLSIVFAISPNETPNLMIGNIGLYLNKYNENAGLGYFLRRDLWNKGIMTQALSEVISYGFKILHLHKISAEHYESNPASGRVMQKCGMVKEMVLRDDIKRFEKYNNVVYYGIINESAMYKL